MRGFLSRVDGKNRPPPHSTLDEGDIVSALNESDVRAMLDAGTSEGEVIRQLVATGSYTRSGANEIVRFMTRGPDALMSTSLKLPRPKRVADSSRAGVRRGSWR